MNAIIRNIFVAATLITITGSAFSQEAKWLTNYAQAVEQAKAQNKPILLDFSGSDWCGGCIAMKKEVLDTPAFQKYARQSLILMEVDFPQIKPQAEEIKAQNLKLQERYGIDGLPSFVLVDKDGKVLGIQEGYLDGGPEALIAKLNSFFKPASNATSKTDLKQ